METPRPRGHWGSFTTGIHRSWPDQPNQETVWQMLQGMDPSEPPTLTDRVTAVAMLDDGKTPARAIAERLGCTMRTVQRYRSWRRRDMSRWQRS